MAIRYCTPEQEAEIIRLYKSGEYSYRQIGEMKNLSKGTIINIVKGYPYTQDKGTYYSKLQFESTEKLKQEVVGVRDRAKQAYMYGDLASYGVHTRQWLMLLDMLPDRDKLYERLKDERNTCEQKAWECFGRGNHREFGFYADTWGLLSYIIGDNAKNPWGILAKESGAKSKSKSVKYTKASLKRPNINFSAIVQKANGFRLSDKSWEYICPLVPENDIGRPSNHRRLMEGILYALIHCHSIRKVPREYGDRKPLTEHFAQWYKDDVFTDLLMFAQVCPELEPAQPALLQLEKHRLVYGDLVPRLCDIQRGVEIAKEKCAESVKDT